MDFALLKNELKSKGVKFYYEDEWTGIIHSDCRLVLPLIPDKSIDLVLTDPPFPDTSTEMDYCFTPIDCLNDIIRRQLIFWSPLAHFPLSYTAIHIWDKNQGCVSEYERIFERYGHRLCHLYRYNSVNSPVSAKFAGDVFLKHPSQKPQKLISCLITDYTSPGNLILDPFLGSGTTCYCAKKLNRYSIGIEIEEKYCEIAAKRCSQGVMRLEV